MLHPTAAAVAARSAATRVPADAVAQVPAQAARRPRAATGVRRPPRRRGRLRARKGGVVLQNRPLDTGPQFVCCRATRSTTLFAPVHGMPRLKGRLQHGLDVVGYATQCGGFNRRDYAPSVDVGLPANTTSRRTAARAVATGSGRRRRPRRWRRRRGARRGRAASAPSPSPDSWRAGPCPPRTGGRWPIRAPTPRAPVEVCVDAPDLGHAPAARRRQIQTGALRRRSRSPGPHPQLASAHGSALTASAETGCACVGERGPTARRRRTRAVPRASYLHALSTTKRKREMSRGPFGSSWIAKSWPSRRQA